MPKGVIYVGRPTKWGNPYKVSETLSREQAVDAYRMYIQHYAATEPSEVELNELRGKDLACWCPLVDKDGNPVPCHADVLLEIANS